jgi:glucosamine-6-phosphate deaminase
MSLLILPRPKTGQQSPITTGPLRRAHLALTEQTRHDNARFFTGIDEVPRHVITQGLGTISAAGHLVVIATGSHKAQAVAAAVEGPLAASCPGSVLQRHPHVTVVVDKAAAAQLKNADFYRYALKYKPAQQKY